MNILITGAGGKIGQKLLSALKHEPGLKLFILDRNQSKQFPDTRFGDLLNPGSLLQATHDIDVIIHLAAVTHTNDEQKYFQVNTEGTKNLVKAAGKNGVKKIIFISSRAAVPGGGAYAQSKLQAEEALKNSSLDWLILKISEVYGISKEGPIEKIIQDVENKKAIFLPGRGQQVLQPVCADDVINAIITAVRSEQNKKTYLIAGPQEISYRELVEKIAANRQKKIRLMPVPIRLIRSLLMILPNNMLPIKKDQLKRLTTTKPNDIEPARKELKYCPQALEEFLK